MNTTSICFANNKGGSGKSTTCSNVGYALTLLGKKVLMIDGDMQLNLSLSFFDEDEVMSYATSEKNVYYGMKNLMDLKKCIVPTKYKDLDLIPSSILMSTIEYELYPELHKELMLKKGLLDIKASGKYDYILIDAPPTLGGWVMNILGASDYLVIPVEATPWGLFGLANMFEFLREVQKISSKLTLLGIVITKVDIRKKYFKQTMKTLESLKGARIFETRIRVDSAIEWAQDNSMPVVAYSKGSRSASEYIELAKEINGHVSR